MVTYDRSFLSKICLVLCAGMMLHFSSAGQTGAGNGGGQTLFSQSYDTLVSGQGYGKYTISFPAWNPEAGELVAVRIRSQVSVQYGFTLRDVDSLSDTYTVMVGREDGKDSVVSISIGAFLLDPGSDRFQVPYTLLNNYTKTDSITEHLEMYTGGGRLQFNYSPVIWSNVTSNNHSKYYYSAVMRDSTRFSLTYLYTGKVASADSGLVRPPVSQGMMVYPNPATDFIQLVMADAGDWQVTIYTGDGRLVQGNNFYQTNQGRVNFSHKLPSGVYYVRAIDSRTNRRQAGVFMVR